MSDQVITYGIDRRKVTYGISRSKMTEDQISFLERVAKEVVDFLSDTPLEVDGTPKVTVKYSNATFKTKTIMAGWNFFMQGAYVGARGRVVFDLTPEDAQEYESAEFLDKVIDDVFPMAGVELAKHTGSKKEDFLSVFYEFMERRAAEIEEENSLAKEAYKEIDGFGAF